MQESTLARRYAAALVALASEQGVLEETGREVDDFAQLVATTPTLRALLESPASDRAQQKITLESVLAKTAFSTLACNFLRLLAQKRRMHLMAEIAQAYGVELDQRAGKLTAKVRAAIALTQEHVSRLEMSLSQVTGKTVSLEMVVEPELLGGMVVQIGSTMMDFSVRNRLNRLKSFMKG